jgi:hypothetical protein
MIQSKRWRWLHAAADGRVARQGTRNPKVNKCREEDVEEKRTGVTKTEKKGCKISGKEGRKKIEENW